MTVHTAISAFIGGLFAYTIARIQNHRVGLKDINGYLKLMNKTITLMIVQSDDIHKALDKRSSSNFEDDIRGFLCVLFDKTQAMDKNASLFLSYWERYGETLQLHSTKFLRYNSVKRRKYEDIISSMEDISSTISEYISFSKQYEMQYKLITSDKESADEIHMRLEKKGYHKADSTLTQLTEKCKRIQSQFNELHI